MEKIQVYSHLRHCSKLSAAAASCIASVAAICAASLCIITSCNKCEQRIGMEEYG